LIDVTLVDENANSKVIHAVGDVEIGVEYFNRLQLFGYNLKLPSCNSSGSFFDKSITMTAQNND